MPERGKFVVFEGPDGSGKTTVIEQMQSLLEFYRAPVHWLREPGGTPLGDHLRELLKFSELPITPHAETLLFNAARAQLVSDVIKPALERGEWVVVDRFSMSTDIFQGVGRQLGSENVRPVSQFAVGDLSPDLTIVFDVPLEEAQRRIHVRGDQGGERDRIDSESESFQRTINTAYRHVGANDPTVVHIDASGTRDVVFSRAWDVLVDRLEVW